MDDCDDGASEARLLLVVDDEPLVRALLVRVLTSRGFEALEAENGVEALKLVTRHRHRIGAVISDVRMPKVDGVRLAEVLAATQPHIPVALMSSTQDGRAAEDLPNVKHWFIKPFEVAEVVDKVERLLAGC